ncbi:MAG: N-acetylmuramoyl-L-alanine amidase [Actinomycetota bacterium]|nr:N-acetylmuramoyl-L-alanine amidase [Actinomycetota bacterium]
MIERNRLLRLLAAGPVGALLAVGLAVVPSTTVQAQVVHHTKAGEVSGPLDRSEVRRLPFPARHVALYWAGNPDAEVVVAFSTDGVTFTPPSVVERDEVGMQRNNGQTYGTVVPAGDATFAKVTTDRPLGRLTVLSLAEDGTSVQRTPVPAKPAGAAPTVLPRGDWGADESLRFNGTAPVWPPVFQTVQKLVVHHTAGANGETGEAAKATIRSIYYYHAVTQGWGDIGYNFLIDAAGVVYKGRSTSPTTSDPDVTGENASAQGVTAGHAYGYNSGTVGVALLGNFVSTLPTQAAQDALRSLLVSKAGAHGLHPATKALYTNPVNGTQATFENVPGHQEVPDNATECPGGLFLDQVLRFMRDAMVTPAGPADTAAPANPTGLTGAVNKRSVQLKWSASSGDAGSGGGISGVAGYDVWRSSAGGPLVRIASTTGTSYTDTVTGAKAKYDYVVKTYDGAANRSPGATVRVTA